MSSKDVSTAAMIFETIVISTNVENQPHIAPFGVRFENDLVLISPYRPSTTLNNLLATKTATLNLTDDVRVFAGAMTGRRNWPMLPTMNVRGYYLADSLVHHELSLVKVKDDSIRPTLTFKVLSTHNHLPFKGFNRAQAAVIELCVLASRLDRLSIEKIETEMVYLQIAIDKTAGEREIEAWGWLNQHIADYKKQVILK